MSQINNHKRLKAGKQPGGINKADNRKHYPRDTDINHRNSSRAILNRRINKELKKEGN